MVYIIWFYMAKYNGLILSTRVNLKQVTIYSLFGSEYKIRAILSCSFNLVGII